MRCKGVGSPTSTAFLVHELRESDGIPAENCHFCGFHWAGVEPYWVHSVFPGHISHCSCPRLYVNMFLAKLLTKLPHHTWKMSSQLVWMQALEIIRKTAEVREITLQLGDRFMSRSSKIPFTPMLAFIPPSLLGSGMCSEPHTRGAARPAKPWQCDAGGSNSSLGNLHLALWDSSPLGWQQPWV